jgi:hypothetical protein
MSDTSRRAFAAAAIAAAGATVGIAGLGHLFLRELRRAAAWFVVSLGAGVALLLTAFGPARFGDPTFVRTLLVSPDQVPESVVLPLFVLLSLSVLDAYLVGRRRTNETGETNDPTCPACGKPIDGDIDFCHWCTTRFETPER